MLNRTHRELDEKAAIQRKRQEEAEKKVADKKAGLGRIPDRSAPSRAPEMARNESRDRPASGGPPKLNLAGNKPTWRERQVAKEAEEAAKAAGGPTSAPPPAAPSTDIATEEAALPKRTGGYVPPARRADGAPPRGRTDTAPSPAAPRDASSSVEPTAKWRPGARGDAAGRDGSPADSLKPRFSGLRQPSNRDTSPADGDRPLSSSGTARTESPASERPAPGKYVPVQMRNKGLR